MMKKANELKKIYFHQLDKRKEFLKNTEFGVDDIFGDIISIDERTKLINFLANVI